ncbi:beta strand repeat-containing protein [Halobaculum lipolyticum]|uniref:Beta strand repeat-containing protein n=1 Tax=Halobaculum lipolyticum TaxID=3032001 RepID=A0ABD5W8H5_9EURY
MSSRVTRSAIVAATLVVAVAVASAGVVVQAAGGGTPEITGYDVTNPSGSTIEVTFQSNETLDVISVGIDQETDFLRALDETDFAASGTGPYTYTATFTVASDGNFTADLSDARDADGNDGADTGSFQGSTTVDTTSPTITDVAVSDDTNTDGVVAAGDTIRVRVEATDATSNVSTVTANLSAFGLGAAEQVALDAGTVYEETYVVPDAPGPDGTYTVAVNATDDASPSNTAQTTGGTLELDTTPPALSDPVLENATSPGDSVADDSQIRVAVNATDAANEVATVEADLSAFGVDGGNVTLSQVGSTEVYEWTGAVDEAAANADGNYSVQVVATDNVTNADTVDTPDLWLNTDPDLSGFAVVPATGQEVTVSFTSSEPLGDSPDAIGVELTGAASISLDADDFAESGSGPYTYEATTDLGTDGTVTATLESAEDPTGRDGAAAETDDATVDTTPPAVGPVVLVDDTDGDGVVAAGDTVRVEAPATDATSTVSSVTADLTALGIGPGDRTLTYNASAGAYDRTVTVEADATEGAVSAAVTATDSEGLSNTTTGGAVTVDTTAPAVSAVTVVDGDGDGSVVEGEAVTVTATVTDAHLNASSVTADLSAYGAGVVTLTDGDGDDVFDWTTNAGSGGTEGAPTVVVDAVDDPGNAGSDSTGGPVYDAGPPDVASATLTDETDGNGAVGDDDEVSVAVELADATGVASVTANATDFGAGTVALADSGGGVWEGTFTVDRTTAAGDGDYPVAVNATDDEGQSVSVDSTTLSLDSTAPTIDSVSLTDAADGDAVVADGGTLRVVADVTDAGGVSTVG